ncbi:MAG: hypothetical protein NTX40_06940 [Planctomycetota bacterium]|nr:hypothetical protein [Planctomycetota bacterium]
MQRIACVSAALAALALSARPAGEAAVKILIPSMLILMSVVLIIFSPIIVRFIRQGVFAP